MKTQWPWRRGAPDGRSRSSASASCGSDSLLNRLPEIQGILDSGRLFPAELAARWVTFLASGEADDLSGRELSVTSDMDTLVARSDEIRREGKYALRLIE